MNKDLEQVELYKEAKGYNQEQEAVRKIADALGLSIHQVRARLTSLGIYHPKPANKSNRVLKARVVQDLIEALGIDVSDSEEEYLNRLTVVLLNKMIKSVLAGRK